MKVSDINSKHRKWKSGLDEPPINSHGRVTALIWLCGFYHRTNRFLCHCCLFDSDPDQLLKENQHRFPLVWRWKVCKFIWKDSAGEKCLTCSHCVVFLLRGQERWFSHSKLFFLVKSIVLIYFGYLCRQLAVTYLVLCAGQTRDLETNHICSLLDVAHW